MTIKVFDRTFEALSKSLDMRSQQQTVISANIANSDTPGYQAKQLDFEGALSKALDYDRRISNGETGRPFNGASPVDDVEAEMSNQVNNVVREDGNTVDRDAEMTALYQNQLLYNASVDLVRKKLAMLKYSITDGGGH